MWDFLHEKGYTAHNIPDLTIIELNALKLGHMVREEQKADAKAAALGGGSSATERNKAQHKRRIRNEVFGD